MNDISIILYKTDRNVLIRKKNFILLQLVIKL